MTAPGRQHTIGDPKGTRTHDRLTAFRKAQQRVQQMNAEAKTSRDDDREDGTLWALDS